MKAKWVSGAAGAEPFDLIVGFDRVDVLAMGLLNRADSGGGDGTADAGDGMILDAGLRRIVCLPSARNIPPPTCG